MNNPRQVPSLVARMNQPLIAVPFCNDDGEEEVHYFVDEEDADQAVHRQSGEEPINLAGIWSDLDADDMLESLDRIRHESKPTPPITSI